MNEWRDQALRDGTKGGRRLIYFHGAPGGPGEAALFDDLAREAGVELICPDRFALAPGAGAAEVFDRLADQVRELARTGPLELAGFSLGGFAALQVCARLGNEVARLHLISAAAPLEAGRFLEDMAGRPVFLAAKVSPIGFRLLTAWQGWLARRAPQALHQLLFTAAAGADRALAQSAHFKASVWPALSGSLNRPRRRAYRQEVATYVRPWADDLARVSQPVSIWHGEADTWAPPGMGQALHLALPGSDLRRLTGLSHYSTLVAAMGEILRRPAEGQASEASTTTRSAPSET